MVNHQTKIKYFKPKLLTKLVKPNQALGDILVWFDPATYQGETKDGKLYGKGILKSYDGTIYDG